MLMLATIFWGISFPTMKALGILQERLLPGASSWFVTGLVCALRFGAAAVIMAVWSRKTLPQLTLLEVRQGLGLGIFGGAGLLLQMDGLAYTTASTSAFLTQCYCLILPVYAAVRDRRWPSPLIAVCSLIVISGVAVLSDLNWRNLQLGRGEVETLIASVIFTGQILWLEHPRFAGNRVNHFTVVMFVVMTLLALPPAIGFSRGAADWRVMLSSPALLGLASILVLLCTMVAYVLMNHWQRFLPAAEAGLIYCAEPVFASAFALFLPGWFSAWFGLDYPNESVTVRLLAGGGLITLANLLVQLLGSPPAPPPKASIQP
jgi:drug/metabolite transporter (DMT)-like permease